jgi:hypothetical protein
MKYRNLFGLGGSLINKEIMQTKGLLRALIANESTLSLKPLLENEDSVHLSGSVGFTPGPIWRKALSWLSGEEDALAVEKGFVGFLKTTDTLIANKLICMYIACFLQPYMIVCSWRRPCAVSSLLP